jgi:uncharacterized membrane protein (UPF0127 family)
VADLLTWKSTLRSQQETARFFLSADVIDIAFSTGHTWEVYVAISDEDRGHGLRGVKSLDVDGMLFYFERPSSTAFTMEGMSMDLDVAWFDSEGKLIQSGTYKANDPYPLLCNKEFSYVLESEAGTFGPTDLVV